MDRENTKAKALTILKTVFVYLLLILYMVPFALVLINSLKSKVNIVRYPLELVDPNGPQWGNYVTAWVDMEFPKAFMNSFIITGFSILLLIVFSAMAAYLFVRTDWKVCKVR